MELGQLRALRELGDRGSIAAVAAALFVTPSSVSQQISALQRRVAVPLTVKDGRRTVLTDAGRALAAAAIDVETALERAEQAVARFQGDPVAPVSVAAFHSAGLTFFGPLIASSMNGDVPAVRLTDFDVAQERFALLTTDNDLVVAHRMVGSPPWPTTVRVEPLLYEPLDIAIRCDHPLASRAAIEPGDLRDESWVAVHAGFPLDQALAIIAGSGGSEPRVVHRVNDFSIAVAVVEAGGCVALMPRYTVDLRDHPNVVLRPLAGVDLGRHIDCLARPETLERTGATLVLERIRAIAATLTR